MVHMQFEESDEIFRRHFGATAPLFRDGDHGQLIEGLFNASHVGLVIVDDQFRYVALNAAVAAMNGLPAADHIGKTIYEIMGDAAAEVESAYKYILNTGKPVSNFLLSAKLPTRSEVGHWIENYFPIRNADGQIKQIGAVVVEITEQRKLEETQRYLSAKLECERERLQLLLQVNATLVSSLDLQHLFPAIARIVDGVIKHDFASLMLYDASSQLLRKYAESTDLTFPTPISHEAVSIKISPAGQAFLRREVQTFSREQLAEFPGENGQLTEHGVQTLCCLPLITRNGPLGIMALASQNKEAFVPQDVNLLKQIAAQIAIALDNSRAYREIAELKDKLAQENIYLQGEIRSELNFEEIVGESPALKGVLNQAKTVAASDATVLILGETGTGKELIARAVHRMSLRKDTSFIKMNCAAIPTGLLESELFGHEKGAFTGAVSQKIGRLELADKGTLFLDEIGDIPLELQPKLLRVLQDQEFERLGGTRTIKVNIRLIAATNRDLNRSVIEKTFRSDLYYRLNVFPIRAPLLKDRKEDIPLLVRYFVQKFARRISREIHSIPIETMNVLANWDWPGNVRELENFIERSVILSDGPSLKAPLAELEMPDDEPENDGTLESLEREYIVRVLRETNGVIAGSNGAAARLGLKRTTLQSRILRMGITRDEYAN